MWQLFLLALVQGIAEWFPISSSGHLVLVSYFLNYPNTLLLDVALHFGTLMAVFVYFGKEITDILQALFLLRFKSREGKLGLMLLVATLPAAFFGYLFKGFLEQTLNSLSLLALGLAITGIVLLLGSLDLRRKKKPLGYGLALIIGLAQVFSLFRGISRSATTISTGLLLGLEEKEAVTFSFLLSIPVILGANFLVIGNHRLPPELLWATLVSFFTGLLTIHLLLKIVVNSRKNLRWFALYVLSLAAGIGIYLILG